MIIIFVFSVGRTLKDIRQDGLRIRDEIFAKATFQVGYNTSKLERIYRDAFGDEMTMDSVKYPRYLCSLYTYAHHYCYMKYSY